MLAPGLYFLALRDRLVALANVPPPRKAGRAAKRQCVPVTFFSTRDAAADFLFNACGADPTFLYETIRDDEYEVPADEPTGDIPAELPTPPAADEPPDRRGPFDGQEPALNAGLGYTIAGADAASSLIVPLDDA
jgi:hypothetical protein